MHPHASALRPQLANKPRRRRPLISLTPLIDMVFILLVFFMLASSFLDWRSIDLSAPARAGTAPSAQGALLVEVRPDGLRLSGRTVTPKQLASQVSRRVNTRPEQRVLVKPAAGVALQKAVVVLDSLSAAGATRLALIRDGTD